MKKFLILTLFIFLILTACGQSKDESAALANPAAVYCQEQNGILQTVYSPAGEDALCVFDNGSHCWQWDYYRGECEVGECFRECKKIGSKSEGWYDTCGGILIAWAECSKNPDWQVEIRPVPPSEESEEAETNQPEPPVVSAPTQNENIIVTAPSADQAVTSPFLVTGQAKVFEGTVNLRVKNPPGDTMFEAFTTARGGEAGEWSNFSVTLNYAFTHTKEGLLEVYSISPKDGSEENLVGIPLKFE